MSEQQTMMIQQMVMEKGIADQPKSIETFHQVGSTDEVVGRRESTAQ